MSCVLITTATQPTPAQGQSPLEFYASKYPESSARIATWTKSQPGVQYATAYVAGPLSIKGMIVFDTMENLNAYKTARQSNTDVQHRNAYVQQNGITVTETIVE